MRRLQKWTRGEDRAIRRLYPHGTWRKLLLRCKRRSVMAIRRRAAVLGVRQYAPWTDAEDFQIRRYYGEYSRKLIMQALPGRSWAAIRARAFVLGVARRITAYDIPIDEQLEDEYGTSSSITASGF
jgi:hypothetical protein